MLVERRLPAARKRLATIGEDAPLIEAANQPLPGMQLHNRGFNRDGAGRYLSSTW